jgi:predicted peptidase
MPTSPAPRLLRIPYTCTATGAARHYLLYLPAGYDADPHRRWPVLLFLHGGGERGDGQDDLDYVLTHGPLGEAWVYRRDLPFIMIGPQLPVFDLWDQVQMRADRPKPARLVAGVPPRLLGYRPSQPMARAPYEGPPDYPTDEAWGWEGAPGGWHLVAADLLAMVDATLAGYRADPARVYLTGLSYGGYGAWYLAVKHPDRWAAVAPICGGGDPQAVGSMAAAQLPVWIFHGGRDIRVRPQWSYTMAQALEAAGHTAVRLTVHEDLGHNCWARVYAGEDLYAWFLAHHRPAV